MSCLLGSGVRVAVGGCSWDLDLADPGRGCSLRDVEGEQAESVRFACGVDRPPEVVPARVARGQGRVMTQWAFVALERGECDAALGRLVTVVEQIAEHGSSVPLRPPGGIG